MISQKRSVIHLQNININDEWETPPELLLKGCKDYEIFPIIDMCKRTIFKMSFVLWIRS